MGVAEFIAALKAIPALVDAVKGIAEAIEKLQISITEKNLEDLKTDVSYSLNELLNAGSSNDRKRIIAELNKKLSK